MIGSTQNGREYLYEALDFAAKGKVKVMAETYLLADAPKAYQRVAEGKPRFPRYPLARHRAPRNPIAGAWRWTRPMAGRIDPVRAGESVDFEVKACDAKGRLALPSGLVRGSGQKDIGRRRALNLI